MAVVTNGTLDWSGNDGKMTSDINLTLSFSKIPWGVERG